MRAIDAVCAAATALAAAMLVSLALVSLTTVVLGWLRVPTPLWLGQASRTLLCGFVFLSIGPGLRAGSHLSVESLTEWLPERAKRILARLVALVLALFLLAMTIGGVALARAVVGVKLPGTGWPLSVYYLAVPLGGLVGLLVAIELMVLPPRPAAPAGEDGAAP